jgi:acetyl esterase/lipase
MMLALKQTGQSLPVCAALMSPWVDMECLGESLTTNEAVDPMVQKPMVQVMISLFLGEGDRRNPLANPLHGDFGGLPPIMIQVGERETLHDDSIRVARKARDAGVSVDLKVWQGQVHVFQIFAARLDEGALAIGELGVFLGDHLS